MTQMARNVSMADLGFLKRGHRLLHDRDTKFSAAFRATLGAVGVESVPLPPHSPNLNAVAERWVRSVKDDGLNRVVLFGEGALRRCLREYLAHYHGERNHHGRENRILLPHEADRIRAAAGAVQGRARLGGLLRFYRRIAGCPRGRRPGETIGGPVWAPGRDATVRTEPPGAGLESHPGWSPRQRTRSPFDGMSRPPFSRSD